MKHRSGGTSQLGLKVAPTTPEVIHLLFADDSFLFLKANGEAAEEVNQILDMYSRASGQRINLSKSSIYFSKSCPNGIREVL